MKVTFTNRASVLQDSVKQKMLAKLGKFDRYFEPDATAHVTIMREKSRQTVEVTIQNKGMIFRAEETTHGEIGVAFDMAVDAIVRQIHKNKARLEKRLRSGAFAEEEKELQSEYHVVRVKKFTVKPMDVEEAILQMNLSGHVFFTFLNSETDTVNVVYKRSEGGYGLLAPEIG